MLSHNSDYGESEEFVQYGPSKVGLTDCGFSCKVACGCNNDKGWYLAVPDGNYDTKKSARTYDYIIDDDGKLASSGTTLSSAGRTLSGSTKSLSAGGSTITCTKQTCSDGYTATKPSDTYFRYVTETLRHGQICYKVTGCKYFDEVKKLSYYADKSIASGTDGATAHNGTQCYDVLCSDENSNWYEASSDYYLDHNDNVSSQSRYGNTCYTNGRYHNISWCPSGQTVRDSCPSGQYTSASRTVECTECSVKGTDTCRKCSDCPTKVDVGSCEVGTTQNASETRSECGTYYTAKRNKNHAEACGSDYTSVPSGYHCDSYASPCGFTCYKNCKPHNYSWCDTSNGYSLTECNSCQVETDSEDVECTGCSSTSTSDTCYKCRAKDHKEACGSNYTAEPDDKDCTEYTSCGFKCYKDCKDKVQYYTVTIKKEFGSSCSGISTGGFDGIGGNGCVMGTQNCWHSGMSSTVNNVEAGSSYKISETGCYQAARNTTPWRVYFYDCSGAGCSPTAGNGSNVYDLTGSISGNSTITITYECEAGDCGGIGGDSCPSGYYSSQPSDTYFKYETSGGCYKVTGCKSPYKTYSSSLNAGFSQALASTYSPQSYSCYTQSCASGYTQVSTSTACSSGVQYNGSKWCCPSANAGSAKFSIQTSGNFECSGSGGGIYVQACKSSGGCSNVTGSQTSLEAGSYTLYVAGSNGGKANYKSFKLMTGSCGAGGTCYSTDSNTGCTTSGVSAIYHGAYISKTFEAGKTYCITISGLTCS